MGDGFAALRSIFDQPKWFVKMAFSRIMRHPRKRLKAQVQLEQLKKIRKMRGATIDDQ